MTVKMKLLVGLLLGVWCFLCAVTFGKSQGKLEILPEGAQVTKPAGSRLALTCSVNVESPSLIRQLQWMDTSNRTIDVTNPEAPLYIQKLNGESGIKLIFSKLTENLTGTYTCTASYATTEQLVATTTVNTIVGITWLDAPESQYPVLGTDYKIRCEVTANPAPAVDWLKNGEDISDMSNGRYVVHNNGLLLKKVKESDDGVYTCRAVVFNTGEIQTKNIKVEVQIPPHIKPMRIVEIVEGEQASTVCNGTGKPPPSYTWIKENTREDLSSSDRFTVNKSTGLLMIHHVEFNDDSLYKCVAKNPAGRDEMQVKINVLLKPQIYELFNITASVGSNAKIICKAKGRPAPKILFRKLSNREPFRNGQQEYDPRIIQEYEDKGETIGILSFDRLNRSDDGLYACIAENKVETAYKNGHITVEFPPNFDKTRDYPPVWTWNNKPGNLTCLPEAIPNATIRWRYNQMYIENNTSPNIQIYGYGSSLIVRPHNEPRFYTTYECIVMNKLGSASHKIELREAIVPAHIQQAKPVTITPTTVIFSIVGPPLFYGLPLRSITVQYQTEQKQTWNTAREHTWSYNATYILESLVPEEVYNFRFAARNDVGLGAWASNQQIKMPRRSVPAEPKIIVEGDLPSSETNYIAADLVTNSHNADQFKLQWSVPNDNGDPIDSYTIRYCVTQKVNGVWRDSENECSGEINQSVLNTSYDMNTLRPDTIYKVELRARNAIGLSTPAEIRVKTARVTFGKSQGKLEILPEGAQVTKPAGSRLALTCSVNVESPSLIRQLQWMDTSNRTIDVTNPEAPLYIQKLNGESGIILIFSKLTENLAGTYTCTANYANTEQLVATTTVNTIVDITWLDAPESQYPLLGTDYKIRCEVRANPAPTVDWLKNGEDISDMSNDRYVVHNNGLLLKKVTESDDGVYTCRAAVFSTGEIQTKTIKVEVQIPPHIKPMRIVEIVEGEQASTVCNGTGKPPPSYTWIKENTREDLSSSDRFTVNKSTGLLMIHHVEFNDDSLYKCVAKNPAGRDEMQVKINVLLKPQIYELFNITASVGSNAKIICKAKGRPAPKILFRKLSNREPFRNGQQEYDPRIIQEYEDKGETIGILNFDRLNRSDDGLYACIAENKVETAYKNGHITVEFPPTFDKTRHYSPVWTWNNKPVNLTCLPEAIPNATIRWRYNQMYIENNTSPNIQIYGYGSSLIVRPHNESRFYTTYECIVMNTLGSASHKIELRKATVPAHIQQAKPETVTPTTLIFSIVGPPNFHGLPLKSITVQYQTEQKQTWNTAREHTWSYNATYILESLVPEEVYNFRFAARNDVGLGAWAGDQQIKMPRRSVPAEPKIIVEGHLPSSETNYIAADFVTNSHYADHFKLQWSVPNDNGDPIDSYIIRYCVTQKVNGAWKDFETECSGEIIQSVLHTSYDMNTLRPDTTYKVELRARNTIGLSTPAEIRIKTERGLNLVIYQYEVPSISNATIIGIVVAVVMLVLVIVDIMCCCINRAGILALICDQLRSKPVDELGREEKEHLKPEGQDQPEIMNRDKCNMSVEYDGKEVYIKPGEIIGEHSVV